MNESWYLLSNLQCIDNKISANAVVPAGSPWFSGHFPGEPIVPGIAELSLIYDVIKKFYYKKGNLQIASLKKVRFKYIVKPEELLNIIVTSAEEMVNTYSFKITAGDKLACSGFITLKETD